MPLRYGCLMKSARGRFNILSRRRNKLQKARLKYPEHERKALRIGVIPTRG
jgi:hypothetical protein